MTVETDHPILQMDYFDWDFESNLYKIYFDEAEELVELLNHIKLERALNKTEEEVLSFCEYMLTPATGEEEEFDDLDAAGYYDDDDEEEYPMCEEDGSYCW